ncbi:YhdP family protein [Paucibacter sp. R3-3]|uniref:YhdP family protein n=1 Tax=Roseateles agri TaxID=3098619 RepID=A0ABU5DEB2_9BURK|nr:YhdP family protein [Paucibacter sp. R3-3]MDY0744613.1 YhdP family protein [Paucibacter sp. R3-3]
MLANAHDSAPNSASPPAPHWSARSLRLIWRLLRWALALVGLAWTLVLLAWAVLHWAILPHIDDWRPRLEREASHSLGLQVRIGSIEVSKGGWIPALTLNEVRLLDPQGREALRLPRVAAALSARSLLAFKLRFEQLLLDGPQLEIRRDKAGHISVAGLSVDQPQAGAGTDFAEEVADWFFEQREFAIRQGRIRWVDEQRDAPPLELSALDLVLRNGLRQHRIRLDATPPPAWGERFTLQGKFNQQLLKRAGELKFWSGELYADLPRADLRELRRHVDLPFELSEGDGALRAWITVDKGRPTSATVDMGLRAVKLQLTEGQPPLDLSRIEGRLQLSRSTQGMSLKATQLGFVSGSEDDGVTWPRSNWDVSLKLPPHAGASLADINIGTALGGTLDAERLDLALMAQIAGRLPLGDAPHALLAELAPRGVLSGLAASWDGALEAPSHYRVQAKLDALQLDAGAPAGEHHIGRPGLAGASIQLEATEKGGRADLTMADGRLDFPGLFEEPTLPVTQAAARVEWQVADKPRAYSLKVSNLRIETPDLHGSFDASWHTGSGRGTAVALLPGQLELNGKIARIDAVRVQRYLPLLLGEHARGYVKDAVRSGEARDINVRVRGDLAEFPFDGGRPGQFRIASQVRDVNLAYVPPATPDAPLSWPALEHIDATLVFDRGSMQINGGRASVLGYALSGVSGGIKDLAHQRVLEIDGGGQGPLPALLQFMRASPVDEWTSHALTQATANGNAGLKLSLQLPLTDIAHSSVKGSVQLPGNDLRLRGDVPLLEATRGVVEFERGGLHVRGGQARALGGDLQFEGGTQRDGSLRFAGTGVATAEALRRAKELPVAPQLAAVASGQAAYRLQLGFAANHGQPEVIVTSPLTGLALDLPAPLHKEADATLPLRVQITPNTTGTRDELRVELGNLVQLQYLRDTSGEGDPRVLRGALALQERLPPLPETGVQMQATLGKVNLDAWQAAAQRLAGGTVAATGPVSSGIDPAAASYLPSQIGLRAQSLQFSGREIANVVAGITRASDGSNALRANIDADQLSGFVELRPARGAETAPRIIARLARLSLPKQEADSVSQMLDNSGNNSSSTPPALDVVVDAFELRGKQLGRLEVEARASEGRDWHLSKLRLVHPQAVLNATGEWLKAEAPGGQRRTQLDWRLEVANAGTLLEDLGQGQVLRGGKGVLAGRIGWLGSPLSPDFPSLAGELRVSLDAGQFLKVEPGVGRLLGVLSLQSLPRRLLFDFRDIFSEGFAFDDVSGDVTIAQGLASSENLKIRAVQAAVLLDGSADLARETQNLRVLVVPEINAGGASLAYALINPAIGLGTFLAQLLLNKPLAAASTREFHITGRWDDPKVEPVEHKPEAAAPAASETKGTPP